MKPFLYQVASCFYEEYGTDINKLAFVFPNRRAGLFFQKYLSGIAQKPLFSPAILTISDLFVQLSGKQSADKISMLFFLYEIYVEKSGSAESFDEFLYWGEMLLNDFDDIDKYMANAEKLFSNVTDLREIENDFSFLSEEQVAAIRSFWSSFYPVNDTPNQREFLHVWQLLFSLYDTLRKKLAQDGKGYEGMIFREVAESAREDSFRLPYEKIVFVGLNALTKAEETFLSYLRDKSLADFYWDYASPMVTDPDNKASFFVNKNLHLFPSQLTLSPEEATQPEIEVIGIPSGIGQAKQVYTILSELCGTEDLSADEAFRTAVILPDEQLLIPVLHAIPEQIRRINVTMGYPLAGTPVASLMEYILALQKNVRYVDGKPLFYFRDVLPILNHRYIYSTSNQVISDLIRDITENNRVYIGYSELNKNELLSILFVPVTGTEAFSDYLIRVLEELNKVLSPATESEEEVQRTNDLEQEFIFHYFATVNRMREVMTDAGVEMTVDTYFRLLKRMTDTITIPFHGEPLSGLQVMGVLETRALDFDRIIILSVNEGIYPTRKGANSFIPYNLRKGFGLPTYEHQDSVWAYHFYRLIYRAQKVSLLYDTRSNGLQTGEVSRFVYQLRYHYELNLKQRLVVYNVSSSKTPALQVPKTPEVIALLDKFVKGGSRAISASAVNTYLDCPLKFYFSVLEGLEEEEEVSETIESNVFGSLLHKVMEELYAPFQGKMVTADLLEIIGKDNKLLTHTIARAFAEVFFKSEVVRPLTGQNFLIGEMIRKYVLKVLGRDSKLTPFRYIESEKKIRADFKLNDGRVIQLKGFIDRVDEVKETIRIIDYKSGSGLSIFNSIESLFDMDLKERPKAIMQVCLYSWMYGLEAPGKKIQPGIYYMRSLFTDAFDSGVYQRIDRGRSEQLSEFASVSSSFEDELRKCLDNIFDCQVPFTQTSTGNACLYCPFTGICGK
ncbi:MAG: PD-(D/E)XK nuclease family protein [Parabacteroides sp.]|nr:PD-(D/E)XK nuclease family protein [Parabacteroides sp.]